MSRKAMNAAVFFLAVLLTTVPAWSATSGYIGPANPVKSLSTDLDPAAVDVFNIKIILAGGGNGGGGIGPGDCDGSGPPDGTGLGPGPGAGPGPGDGDGDGAGSGGPQ